jgi:hypothetical protein
MRSVSAHGCTTRSCGALVEASNNLPRMRRLGTKRKRSVALQSKPVTNGDTVQHSRPHAVVCEQTKCPMTLRREKVAQIAEYERANAWGRRRDPCRTRNLSPMVTPIQTANTSLSREKDRRKKKPVLNKKARFRGLFRIRCRTINSTRAASKTDSRSYAESRAPAHRSACPP